MNMSRRICHECLVLSWFCHEYVIRNVLRVHAMIPSSLPRYSFRKQEIPVSSCHVLISRCKTSFVQLLFEKHFLCWKRFDCIIDNMIIQNVPYLFLRGSTIDEVLSRLVALGPPLNLPSNTALVSSPKRRTLFLIFVKVLIRQWLTYIL